MPKAFRQALENAFKVFSRAEALLNAFSRHALENAFRVQMHPRKCIMHVARSEKRIWI